MTKGSHLLATTFLDNLRKIRRVRNCHRIQNVISHFKKRKKEGREKRGTVRANVQEKCYNLTMRRVRITYPGAYHHVMNRGYDGNPIFAGNVTKSHFLDYLEDAVTEMKTSKRKRGQAKISQFF